jgi:hypothetical protein
LYSVADAVSLSRRPKYLERIDRLLVVERFDDALRGRYAEELRVFNLAALLQAELRGVDVDHSLQLERVLDLVALEVIVDLGMAGAGQQEQGANG